MRLSAEFIAHLSECDACKLVLAYLCRESDKQLNSHVNRN